MDKMADGTVFLSYSKNTLLLRFETEGRAVAGAIQRKVRATQGTIFPNRKLSVKAGLKVTENNRLVCIGRLRHVTMTWWPYIIR